MAVYNASNTRHVRTARKEERQRESERRDIITRIMASSAGRFYFYDRLIKCHIFETTFTDSGRRSAFAEGERNIGLQDQIDLMRYCPDQYIAMFREAAEREIANARRISTDVADGRSANGGWDDSGSGDELVERSDDPYGDSTEDGDAAS